MEDVEKVEAVRVAPLGVTSCVQVCVGVFVPVRVGGVAESVGVAEEVWV